MSTQAMNNFLSDANSNRALAEGLVAAVGDKSGDDAVNAVSDFAASEGYDVTPTDAEGVRSRVADAAGGQASLSDGDLESVSGGVLAGHVNVPGIGSIDGSVDGSLVDVIHQGIDGVSNVGKGVVDFMSKW